MTQNGITLKIDDNLNFMVEKITNGIVSHKIIKPDALTSIIKKSIKTPLIKSGLLPDKCISFSSDTKDNRFVAIDFDVTNVDKVYEKTKFTAFPIPRIIFGFKLDSHGNIIKTYMTVAERGKTSPATKLYKYPFSNVSEFSLCIGNNTMPKIKSLHQLNSIPYYIFSMPDNNDRYKKANTKLNMEYRTLLAHLKDKSSDYYYSDVLIESKKTLSDFINYCNKD